MAVLRSFRNPWWFSSLLLPVLLLLLWPTPTIQLDADDTVYVTVTATSGGPDKINVNWTLDNNVSSEVDAYNVSLSDDVNDSYTYIDDPSNTSLTFTDLTPCTFFTVKVQPCHHNASPPNTAVGGFGEDSTTTDAKAPGTPEMIDCTKVTDQSDSLSVTWIQAQPSGKCDVTSNIVSWRKFYTNGTADSTNLSPPIEAYNITGLKPWTNYNVCVKAAYSSLEGSAACGTGTTDEDIPKDAVKNLNVSGTTTSDTIPLTWGPPDTPNGNITYSINWIPNDSSDSYETSGTTNTINQISWSTRESRGSDITKETSYTIQDLKACTSYTITVTPTTSKGSGPNDTITSDTQYIAPEPPTELTVDMVYNVAQSLSTSWTQAVAIPNCDLTMNTVSWSVNNTGADVVKEDIGPTETSYTITGLNPWTTYSVYVTATNQVGTSVASPCKLQTTDEDIPTDAVKNLDVFGTTTSDTIPLTWDPPDTPNGDITYNINWIPNESHVKSGTTNTFSQISRESRGSDTTKGTSYTIQDLKACTSYTITVTPTTSKGSGPKDTITSDTQYIAPEPPTELTVDLVYNVSQSLSASWTQAVAIPNCDLTINTVSWSVNITGADVVSEDIGPTETSYTITGLNPWTTYSVCVAATNQVGTSVASPCKLQTTDEDTPGPPINTSAEPKSSSSIIVSWEPPVIPNGILTGYTVRWTPDSNDGTDGQQLMNNNTFSYSVINLTECTLYTIFVFPATSKGDTTTPGVVESSTETKASPPALILCKNPEAHKLTVDWTDSTSVCPVIRYLVHYEGQVLWSNNTDTDDTTTNVTSVNLEHLISWTTYSVCVKAQIFDDTLSDNKCCMETTKQAAPGKPGSLNKTGSDTNSISFTWTPPDQLNGQLTGYQITWGSSRKNITDPKETTTKISGLKAGTTYTIEVQGMTAGGIGKAIVENMSTKSSNTGVIVGAVVGSLLLIVLLVLALVYRNKIREVTSKLGKSKTVQSASHNGSSRPSVPPRPPHIALAPVTKSNWEDGEVDKYEVRQYIQHLEEDTQRGLEEEFVKVRDMSPQHPSHAATRDFNKPKNRYINILPFDHSRVKLPLLPDRPGSDYINANYIMDANNKYYFIATQGPKDNTVNDLWRMVWELKVYTVVMLTNIKEGGKNKCAQYWPLRTDPPLNTGTFTVTNQEEENNTDYTLRYLVLHVGGQKRVLKQYHFTAWEDFSALEHEHQLLDFVKTVRDESLRESQVIVHCSAGVGRTGTFICLWNLIDILERDRSAANVNVRKTVVAMRECRTTMIQSQEQLLYLWKCVAAYLDTPDKWKPKGAYGSYDNPAYTEPIYDNM